MFGDNQNKDRPDWILKAQKSGFKTASFLQENISPIAMLAGGSAVALGAAYGAATLLPGSFGVAAGAGELARTMAMIGGLSVITGMVGASAGRRNSLRSDIADIRLKGKSDIDQLKENVFEGIEEKHKTLTNAENENQQIKEPKESWARKAKVSLKNATELSASGLLSIGGTVSALGMAGLAVASVAIAAKAVGVDMGGAVASIATVSGFGAVLGGGYMSLVGEGIHGYFLSENSPAHLPTDDTDRKNFLDNLKNKVAEEKVEQGSLDLENDNSLNPNLSLG